MGYSGNCLLTGLTGHSCCYLFFLGPIFLRNFFTKYMTRFKGVQKFKTMLEKNAFIAIFVARMIAIIPPPVINIYS